MSRVRPELDTHCEDKDQGHRDVLPPPLTPNSQGSEAQHTFPRTDRPDRQHLLPPVDKKQSCRHLPPSGSSSASHTPRQPTPIRLSLPPTRVHPSCAPIAHAPPRSQKESKIQDNPSRAQPAHASLGPGPQPRALARSTRPPAPGPAPPPPRPASVAAHLGSGCQGRAPRHHLGPPPPPPTRPAPQEPLRAPSQVQSWRRKGAGRKGEKRRARCPPRQTRRRLLPASRNHQHKMATRSGEPALRPPSTY